MNNFFPAFFSYLCIGFIAITLFGFGIFILVRKRINQNKVDISSTWPSTSARILRAEIVKSETAPDDEGFCEPIYYPILQYEFQVDNQIFFGTKLSNRGNETFSTYEEVNHRLEPFQVGSIVPVYYDPADPQNAVLDRVSTKFSIGLILGIIMAILGLCAVGSVLIMIISRGLPDM